MRVNGRTKPTGAMKVIGPIPRRAGGRAHPDGVTDFPPRDGAESRFRSRTPGSLPSGGGLSGGAGPGLAMTNGRRRPPRAGFRRPDVSAGTQSINVGTRKIVNYAWPG